MCDHHPTPEELAGFDPSDDIDELTDAQIEDTVHCRLCGGSMLCGDNECLVHEATDSVVCAGCAESVTKMYREHCREMSVDVYELNRRDLAERAAQQIVHRFSDDALEVEPVVDLITAAYLPMELEIEYLRTSQAWVRAIEALGYQIDEGRKDEP